MAASQPIPMDVKTPLSTFIIDEESTTTFGRNFRERPRHSSQVDFTEWQKKRDEDEKENHFDSQIQSILNAFGKQYIREYIKMKIKTSVYDTIDKELNRKSFTGIPQYYHLRKKNIRSPRSSAKREQYSKLYANTHKYDYNNMHNKPNKYSTSPQHSHPYFHSPNNNDEIKSPSSDARLNEGFQPVYSLRIASSRTEIGADKNEYTAYIIVGSRISPFDSKITVSVKRFVELRQFSSEIIRKLHKIDKKLHLKHEFPSLNRLFGNIDKKKLEKRRNLINLYLQSICEDENAVRHSYFLSFFDFNDGLYVDGDGCNDADKYQQINQYQEDEFRLKCIEETLEIIGMPGGIALNSDDDDSDDTSDSDSDDNNNNKYNHNKKDDEENANYFISQNFDTHLIDHDLNFEVPYDLHHYKNPEYKLIAAVFDIIQQQLEIEETYKQNQTALLSPSPNITNPQTQHPQHQQSGSMFMNAINAANLNSMILNNNNNNINNNNDDYNYDYNVPQSIPKKKRHSRKVSGGGNIAPASLKHLRGTSIIEASYTPANLMEFHPSISTSSGKINGVINIQNITGGWTTSQFKNKFHSSIRGIDGGPRIIRTASEATSDRSLSYKIPTMVAEVWQKITYLLDKKEKSIPALINSIQHDLYPIIQEAMNDVQPIVKKLYNNSENPNNPNFNDSLNQNNNNPNNSAPSSPLKLQNLLKFGKEDHHNNNNNSKQANHGKYVSLFGQGYDGDDDSSSDSDGSVGVRRSIGINHFPFIKAMKEYCLTESRLYEFFLAFENLAIDQVFGDVNIIFGNIKKPNKNNNKNEQKTNKKKHRAYQSSVDWGDYINRMNEEATNSSATYSGPVYQYIKLLSYNYSILSNTSSFDFSDRIQHISRIHSQINLILCEIIYATLKCMMKCLGDIILYKDGLEEAYAACGNNGFDQDVINSHEDSLLYILRDSGYNISFIIDDLKQKIKSEFKEYSSVIFNPLLDGISTIGEISLNCICLMISQLVFDDGQFPQNIEMFRKHFVRIWAEPINYYIADFTECVFYILYQSSIGLVHSASQDLLQQNIFSSNASTSYSSSLWYQILTKTYNTKQHQHINHINHINHHKHKDIIPETIKKNLSVKDILDLVIERTLTNIVDETLIYIKLECEKSFFKKFVR